MISLSSVDPITSSDYFFSFSFQTPAPRIDQQGSLIKNETESTIAKFIASNVLQ